MTNPFFKLKPKYNQKELKVKINAFDCFKIIYPKFDKVFFLESLGEKSSFSRFSYIGFDPKLHIKANNSKLYFGKKIIRTGNPYKLLAKYFPTYTLPKTGFCGGLVGYISHEGTKYFEEAFETQKHPDFYDFEFGLYQDGLIFDRFLNKVFYFSNDEKLDRSRMILELIKKRKNFPSKISFKFLGLNKTKPEYRTMIKKALVEINRGNIFQVVLSLKFLYQIAGNKLKLYEVLRQINPSPYMFYFKFGPRDIFAASPELLINVEGKKIKHFGTLAGTIKRGKNKEEDKYLAKKLQNDEKEKAEHMMLVDLARNDMGRVCQPGTIKIKNLLGVKKFSHVQHLSTEIYGKLKRGENIFSALKACFPAGTLSGAPKIEAMKIIRRLEEEPRGPYGGVGGYFSFNGSCMLTINIRSMYISKNKGVAQVGSGIVYDSKPEKEYQEILRKGQAMKEVLEKMAKPAFAKASAR